MRRLYRVLCYVTVTFYIYADTKLYWFILSFHREGDLNVWVAQDLQSQHQGLWCLPLHHTLPRRTGANVIHISGKLISSWPVKEFCLFVSSSLVLIWKISLLMKNKRTTNSLNGNVLPFPTRYYVVWLNCNLCVTKQILRMSRFFSINSNKAAICLPKQI